MPDYLRAMYARVWVTLAVDYPEVWRDNDLLAWWLRLLLLARSTYPAPAHYPRALPESTERVLVEQGCIEPQGGDAYRFHGLDALVEVEAGNRGTAGGLARARSARRDDRGRLLPASPDDAGGDTLVLTLDNDAGHDAGQSSTIRDNPQEPDASASNPNHAGMQTLVPFAGVQRRGTRAGEDRRGEDRNGGPTRPLRSEGSKPPTRTGARSREGVDPLFEPDPDRSTVPHVPEPNAIACTDYDAHRADHRWFEGVGWKCAACEERRSAHDLTFTEKVAAAQARLDAEADKAPDPGDSPF